MTQLAHGARARVGEILIDIGFKQMQFGATAFQLCMSGTWSLFSASA